MTVALQYGCHSITWMVELEAHLKMSALNYLLQVYSGNIIKAHEVMA